MKKIILFCLSLLISLGLTSYLGIFDSKTEKAIPNNWKTYSKNKNNEITNYPSTEEELHKAQLTVTNQREPQSTTNTPKVTKNRTIMGDENARQIKLSNQISKTWKDSLGHELLRFHPEDTKILIKEEDSLLKVESGNGRLLEQVVVSYLQNDSMLSSFRALVDSESGQVLETWDRTIHERIGHHDKEEALSLPHYQNSGVEAIIK